MAGNGIMTWNSRRNSICQRRKGRRLRDRSIATFRTPRFKGSLKEQYKEQRGSPHLKGKKRTVGWKMLDVEITSPAAGFKVRVAMEYSVGGGAAKEKGNVGNGKEVNYAMMKKQGE